MRTLFEQLRRTPRRELKRRFDLCIANCRTWVQDHGEISLIIGIVSGLIIVEAFKLVVFLLCVLIVVGAIVWMLALPNDQVVTPIITPIITPAPTSKVSSPETDATKPESKL